MADLKKDRPGFKPLDQHLDLPPFRRKEKKEVLNPRKALEIKMWESLFESQDATAQAMRLLRRKKG